MYTDPFRDNVHKPHLSLDILTSSQYCIAIVKQVNHSIIYIYNKIIYLLQFSNWCPIEAFIFAWM